MTRNHAALLLTALAVSLPALAKDPQIASNTSSITTQPLLNSIASSAIGAGAKEPLDISQSGNSVSVKGSNGTTCQIKIAEGNPPKMMGINCK